MSHSTTAHLLKRLAVWLATGAAFTGTAAVLLSGHDLDLREPAARPTPGNEPGGPPRVADESASGEHAEAEPGGGLAADAEAEPGARPSGFDSDDDDALFAALERLERRMAAGMVRARQSVVALEYTAAESPPGTRRVATGVVINDRGDVLSVRIDPPATAMPPDDGKGASLTPIVARDASGRRHRVKWVAADAESGLTLLRIAPHGVWPIRPAARGPNLGSQVFVVGNPFGMGHSVSRGHIAGLGRALELGPRQLGGLIQVQAPLYPGDSGAVVTNLRGEWFGLIRSGLAVPTPAVTRSERDNDFGFAITAHDALWVADQLRTLGRVDRAYLGVRLEPAASPTATPISETSAAERLGTGTGAGARIERAPEPAPAAAAAIEGALLREVLAGTPAAQAGLLMGDFIIALDGQPIRSPHDLTDRLDRIPAQTTIRLGILRGQGPRRRRLTVPLRTASRPETKPRPESEPEPRLGLASPETPSSPPGTPNAPSGTRPAGPGPKPATASLNVIPTAAPSPTVPVSTPRQVSATETSPVRPPAPSSRTPMPVPAPLRETVPPPRPEELKLTLPRAIIERLEQLERRLDRLERPVESPPQTPDTPPTAQPGPAPPIGRPRTGTDGKG